MTNNSSPLLTGVGSQDFLSIQLTYTTQPFAGKGASDIELIHASLASYRHYLQVRLQGRQPNEHAENEEDRCRIANINDMLFDIQSALIEADRERVQGSINPGPTNE